MYAFAAIGVFAFVVGSLVTYQIARATLQPAVQIVEVPVEADTPSVENIVTRLEASNVLTASAAPQVETGNVTTAELNTTDTARDAQVALMRKAAARISSVGGAATLQQAITNGAVSEVNRGRDTVEVEELLRNAANNGLIQVPDGLVDSRGSVDTRSLLLSLVEQAVDECDGLTSNCGNAAVSNAAFNPTAPAARPSTNGEPQFYTVVSGDSLAAISLLYYGNTSSYNAIFNANRGILASPDRIRIGQRLLIPAI